jgi:CDP-diacylglycerol--serine O-phosphatidyltransferase
MHPRFVGRLGVADAVTTANAVLGFVAVAVAFADVSLAARVMLLGAIADGLDGVLARRYGSSEAGPFLDSLADVATFGVAPAVVVYAAVRERWGATAVSAVDPAALAALAVPGLFVAMAVVRLALYTAHDADEAETVGVPSTLAATIIGAAVVAGVTDPWILLGVTAAFAYLMVSPIRYPDLLARDALIMGVVHALAVLVPDGARSAVVPDAVGRGFPRALLILGLAYMFLSPWLYWRGGFPSLGGAEADPSSTNERDA